MTTAIVVGSGPNGLAAAVHLAQQGIRVTVVEGQDTIGGGLRTSELTVPGLRHDHCSAFHPTGIGSPYLRSLGLEAEGLIWRHAEIELAHPLDDGTAAALWRDVGATASGLGADGARWRALFGPLADRYEYLADELMGPLIHVPKHLLTLARFGIPALLPATGLARVWRGEPARALFGGVAAHLMARLDLPLSASVGMMLIAAGHAHGWPVAEGGSASIADALAARLTTLGGRIETGHWVSSINEVTDFDIVMLDTTPKATAELLGSRMPERFRRRFARHRFGPGAYKVDLAVEGGVPWTASEARRAGTVHVGGSLSEVARAEQMVAAGRMPDNPFVLVGQQYLADPTRSVGDTHPVWAYAHVPAGYTGDSTDTVIKQIERFAPGLKERIVGMHVRGPVAMEAYNPNYVGGDIAAGSNALLRSVARPALVPVPYATGVPGVYLCSASTPPGAGVHGMGGFHAAEATLAELDGKSPSRAALLRSWSSA